MNADGSNPIRVTTDRVDRDADPAWSPEGTRIAFARDGDIYVINADGSGETNLTNSWTYDQHPSWYIEEPRAEHRLVAKVPAYYDGHCGVSQLEGLFGEVSYKFGFLAEGMPGVGYLSTRGRELPPRRPPIGLSRRPYATPMREFACFFAVVLVCLSQVYG
jgi:hypothetical protein